MAAANNARDMYVVCNAADLDGAQHAVMVHPIEGVGKQGHFHRVPIRAAVDTSPGATAAMVAVEEGLRVAPTPAGLRRLLVRFPQSFCHGIKEFDAIPGVDDRSNISMGFTLFDHRTGPTEEQARVLANIDNFSARVRRTMYGCERIRTTLGLGAANMPAAQQSIMADVMDLWVSKPVSDSPPPSVTHGNKRGGGGAVVHAVDRPRCRYCYVKVVGPSPTVNEMFLTYLWTPDGRPLSLDNVRRMQNFHVVPFVEFEDIFCNKAMRSLQMKLRECIVYPPAERATHRFSAAFPERRCTLQAAEGIDDGTVVTTVPYPSAAEEVPGPDADPDPEVAAAAGSPAAKRARTDGKGSPAPSSSSSEEEEEEEETAAAADPSAADADP
jgi:hypothetical protein